MAAFFYVFYLLLKEALLKKFVELYEKNKIK